jgi:hypothetical protein
MTGDAGALVLAASLAGWRWLSQREPPASKTAAATADKIQRVDFFMVYRAKIS